jgi:hypothetical protein
MSTRGDSDSTETKPIRGLATIIANSGTLHALAPEPRREDYADEPTFATAHDEWWRQMNLWRVTYGEERQ